MTTDSARAKLRSDLGLPMTSRDSVLVVSDTTVCRALLNAYNVADTTKAAPAIQVHVVRVGTQYLVTNPLNMAGEFLVHYIFDSTYTYRHAWLH